METQQEKDRQHALSTHPQERGGLLHLDRFLGKDEWTETLTFAAIDSDRYELARVDLDRWPQDPGADDPADQTAPIPGVAASLDLRRLLPGFPASVY